MKEAGKIFTTYKNKDNISSNNEAYIYLLFLLSPMISFIVAIAQFKHKSVRKIIVVFGGLYGYFFIPIEDSDATTFASIYERLYDYNFTAYLTDITNIASPDNRFPDIYAFTMFFVGTTFTNNPQFFHMLTGLVYFAVYVALIGYIYDQDKKVLTKSYAVFFLGLVFILSLSAGINGVRWPLAFMVYMYGAVRVLTSTNRKYFFIAALSILIHFSFVPAVLALALYYFLPYVRKPNVLMALAIFSLIAGAFVSNVIFDNSDSFGDVGEGKLTGYTGEGYVEGREANAKGHNFYIPILRYGGYYFSLFCLFLFWFMQRRMKTSKITNNLYGFAILMAAISFMAGAVVDIATNRYTSLVTFSTFTFLVFLGIQNQGSKIFNRLKYVFAPFIILSALLIIKVDYQTLSINLMINPLFVLLID